MKKLFILGLAVVLGYVANSAIVDWQFKITGATSEKAYAGYTIYLVDAAAWNLAVANGIQSSTFSDASVVKDSTTFDDGQNMRGVYTYTSLNPEGMAADRSIALPDDYISPDPKSSINTKDFYYIVVNNKEKAEWKNVASATLTGRESEGQIEEGGRMENTQAVFDGGTWTPVGAGPTPVPEPTTGLLVLAGLAGLALRRRHA